MANIFVSKLGITTHWHPKNWSKFGGDSDWVSMMVAIFNYNPEDTFYYCQTSDKDELSPEQYKLLFPNDNVVWPFDEIKFKKDDPYGNENVLADWFESKNIKLDHGIIDPGTSFFTAFYGIIKSDKARNGPTLTPASMVRGKYSPMIRVLEKTGIPSVALICDPRNTVMFRDWYNRPKIQLSQLNLEYWSDLYNKQTDQMDKVRQHLTYAGLQDSVLIGYTPEKIEDILKNKTTRFGVVCHQCGNGRGARDRAPMIQEFILDAEFDCEIYGKWNEPYSNDRRFKGSIDKIELDRVMRQWRYSFCVPLGDGWATTKYLELIKQGVVPFLHPNYDLQRNTDLPDYLWVKDAKELSMKMEELDANNFEGYREMISRLYQRITHPLLINGQDMNFRIMQKIDPMKKFIRPQEEMDRMVNLWKKFDELEEAKVQSLDWF